MNTSSIDWFEIPVTDMPRAGQRLDMLRSAIRARQCVLLEYTDTGGAPSQRSVRPLACAFWGGKWTLAAWCEKRDDFRSFRLDRIDALQLLERRFAAEPGKALADFLRAKDRRMPSA